MSTLPKTDERSPIPRKRSKMLPRAIVICSLAAYPVTWLALMSHFWIGDLIDYAKGRDSAKILAKVGLDKSDYHIVERKRFNSYGVVYVYHLTPPDGKTLLPDTTPYHRSFSRETEYPKSFIAVEYYYNLLEKAFKERLKTAANVQFDGHVYFPEMKNDPKMRARFLRDENGDGIFVYIY